MEFYNYPFDFYKMYIEKYYYVNLCMLTYNDQYEYHNTINIVYNIDEHILHKTVNMENCYINKLGVVIDKLFNRIRFNHLVYYNSDYPRYPTVRVNRKTNNLHKMLCDTFIKNTNGCIINHIDGNKSNYNLNNLEITTYSGNNKHAMRTGLNEKSSINPIRKIKAVINNRVLIFNTMGEAADCLGLTTQRVYGILNRVSNKGYVNENTFITYFN